MQNELKDGGLLLNQNGALNQIGWARFQTLDCNLENANFYSMKFLQRFRIKRWDYYAVFTPNRFFSATIADLGYAGNIFVYTLDFSSKELHEEGLVIPLGKNIILPRNSGDGNSSFSNKDVSLDFKVEDEKRKISVDWPGFHSGRGINAEISFDLPKTHESMNIVIPIGKKRFYYNRKVNCMPATGKLQYGKIEEEIKPETSLGSLDWGRGVWNYSSFWIWASTSGFLPDGRRIGLNMGGGFGDTSKATENAIILDGVIHKLDQIEITYDSKDYMKPWHFKDNEGRLSLTLTPFKERIATTRLLVIDSEVHQTFGKYSGYIVTDSGERIDIEGLTGFTEEHHARW